MLSVLMHFLCRDDGVQKLFLHHPGQFFDRILQFILLHTLLLPLVSRKADGPPRREEPAEGLLLIYVLLVYFVEAKEAGVVVVLEANISILRRNTLW